MTKNNFYSLNKEEKLQIIEQVAAEQNLPYFAIEKDWWVMQTLAIIFEMDMAEHLLFKGGTSLSKAWHLINRFSEDIDLALSREYLGFSSSLISKSQVKRLRQKSFEFVTTTFYNDLQKAFKEKGFTDVKFDFENLGDGDQDPVSILIYYPAITQYSDYVLPRVKVELGSRSLKDPFSVCQIQSFIGKQFSELPFSDSAIDIPCINPERTFLEKLFLLHEEFQNPQEKMRVNRMSRHLYDIVKIYQSEHKKKIYDLALIESIIKHRERFNGMRGVDYNSLFPPNLNPIPPNKLIKAWKHDYKTMQTSMIPDESPSFSEILRIVMQATKEYNEL
jgi:predicted nucleotidyltransferase component of viral defense system